MNTNAAEIELGNIYEIESLNEGSLQQKLSEMGCIPGTEIEKLYNAPGGDPVAFRIDSYILGLRLVEASQIMVKRVN
jgi:Fe2+ transport system protein FeoA